MIRPQTASGRRPGPTRRGVTVTELAMVLPIVLLFLIGIIDFALLIYAYDAVSEAARAGARYAMVHGSMSAAPVGPAANNATVNTIVRANAPALTAAQLTVTSTWNDGSNNANCRVTVNVSYNYVPILGSLLGMSVNVSGTTTMLITY